MISDHVGHTPAQVEARCTDSATNTHDLAPANTALVTHDLALVNPISGMHDLAPAIPATESAS
jgi:hypothetical protein